MKYSEYSDLCARSYWESSIVDEDVEVMLREFDTHVVVTVRGTEAPTFKEKGFFKGMKRFFTQGGWRDVIRDIRVTPWYNKATGWVHKGFLDGAQAVEEELDGWLTAKQKPVVFNGHSLGAAIAIILALKFQHKHAVLEAVGFGCPNVFIGRGVRKKMRFDCISFRLGSDYVTLIPRKVLGYRLPVKREQLGQPREGLLPSFEDHLIDRYTAQLKEDNR